MDTSCPSLQPLSHQTPNHTAEGTNPAGLFLMQDHLVSSPKVLSGLHLACCPQAPSAAFGLSLVHGPDPWAPKLCARPPQSPPHLTSLSHSMGPEFQGLSPKLHFPRAIPRHDPLSSGLAGSPSTLTTQPAEKGSTHQSPRSCWVRGLSTGPSIRSMHPNKALLGWPPLAAFTASP